MKRDSVAFVFLKIPVFVHDQDKDDEMALLSPFKYLMNIVHCHLLYDLAAGGKGKILVAVHTLFPLSESFVYRQYLYVRRNKETHARRKPQINL